MSTRSRGILKSRVGATALLALAGLGSAPRAQAQIYSRTEIEAWQKAGYTLAAGWSFEAVGVTGSFFRLQQNAFPDPLPDLIDSGLRWRIMQGDFSEGAFHGYYRYGVDRILTGQTAEHSCYGPLYGAKLDVPFGSYNGDQLIGIRAALDTRGGSLSEYHQALGGTASGWSFAPGASLHKTVNTFDPLVRWNGREYEVQCKAIVRYTYLARGTDISFQTKGVEQACDYTINNSQDEGRCLQDIDFAAPQCTQGPTEMWSTDGQVSLELSGTPIVRFPTGEVEVFGPEATVPRGASPADQHPGFFLWNTPRVSAIRWTMSTQKRIDRNGATTSFLYDPSGIAVVDPQGRTTRYLADEQGRLGAIEAPGLGGTPLRWTLTWTPHVWNPRALFPDIVCKAQEPGGFPSPVPCPDQSPYDALTAITEPDGRQYTFSYDFPSTYKFGAQSGWGNVTRVTTPEGAAIEYHYGDDTTTTHTPPGFLPNTCPAFQPSLAFPNPMEALFKRRVTGITTHPDGIGAGKPAYASTVEHESVETLAGGPCRQLQWIRARAADGHFSRTAVCDDPLSAGYYGSLHGQLFAQETYEAAGTMIEATYHGNTGRLGVDTGTSPGALFVDFEQGSVRGGRLFDVRPNRVVHFLDGIWWQERLQYESSDSIPTSTTFVFRTLGNVTQRSVHDASGLVKKEESTYFHPGPYLSRNLLRLPGTTKVGDDATTLVQTEFTYDECCVVGSGAPNLDRTYTTAERGNATTIARYETPGNAGSRIATRTTYFDTGDVKEIVDGRLQLTSTSPTFGLCSDNPQLTTTVTNAKRQSATTVSDCYRGLPLKVTDLNGQVTTKTYDRLGRTLTLTLPGDASPSTWHEYCVFGSADNNCATPVSSRAEQRTVLHEKDGTPGGLYSKTFTDGMGRSVQTRTEAVDDSGTAVEVVTTTEYDQMGRVSRVWGPRFEGPSNSLTPVGGPLTTTTYDALGRVTTLTTPGNLTTTTTYEPYPPAHQVSFVTDPKGNREGLYRDVLGRTIWHDRLWNEAPGAPRWLTTTFQYDAADRLLHRWDPGNNQISLTYDGLGRKKTMRDPDMGGFADKNWQFEYDANGNLKVQVDPNGQRITFEYDELDRMTLKDLPPAGPGPEDVTFFYDGEGPPPPSGGGGGGSGSGTGLRGEYFQDPSLGGPVVLSRVDPALDFTWGGGSPDPSLPADGFSVRWTGEIEAPASDTYTFHVFSDDGVRLWVNGQLLLDRWFDQWGPEAASSTIALAGGSRYAIKVEHYENAGGAEIHLRWSSPSLPKQAVPTARLYPSAGGGGGGAASAIFVKLDVDTKGSWKGRYGADGYVIAGDGQSLPAYATLSRAGHSDYLWSGGTGDERALQKAAGPDRLAACWYSGASFTIDVSVMDGTTHAVALYALDWDAYGPRDETIEVLDVGSGAVLDTRRVTGFTSGHYLVWSVKGRVSFRVTNNVAGRNAVIGGVFFGGGGGGSGASASFVRTDTTTQGSWKGAYGSAGYVIVGDTENRPAWAQVSTGGNFWLREGSTSDPRAPEKAGTSDRVAACWYAGMTFTIDVNLTDGATHEVALYALDWDAYGPRDQTIEVVDVGSGAVLDTRRVTGFTGGHYLVWNVRGHVLFRLTNNVPDRNAVVSALFFGS